MITRFIAVALVCTAGMLLAEPELIVHTVKNNTEYDLLFLDRVNKKNSFKVPARSQATLNKAVKDTPTFALNGNFKDVLAQHAQYVIVRTKSGVTEQELVKTYLQMNVAEGGKSSGGIIFGSKGVLAFTFLAAGSIKGVVMSTRNVGSESEVQAVTIDLDITDRGQGEDYNLNLAYQIGVVSSASKL